MNAIELTEEMTDRKWQVPAWLRVIFYMAMGYMAVKGSIFTGYQVYQAYLRVKYWYVSDVVATELDGKSFRLDPDMRNNKRVAISDMNQAQLTMALWTLDRELSESRSAMSTVNGLTTGIDVIYEKGVK